MKAEDLEKLKEMNDHDLLLELVKSQKEDAMGQKITAIATVSMFAVITIALMIVVPKAVITLNKVQDMIVTTKTAVEQTQTLVQSANSSLAGIDEMIANVDRLVTSNNESLNEAMGNFNNVDFEGLNNAIRDLESVVEPLANLLGTGRQ